MDFGEGSSGGKLVPLAHATESGSLFCPLLLPWNSVCQFLGPTALAPATGKSIPVQVGHSEHQPDDSNF